MEGRRVLLLNAGGDALGMPHYGLAVLAAVLRAAGHTVRVADYQCSPATPPLGHILRTYRPELVGISVMSALSQVADKLIDTVRNWSSQAPILYGGAHASCYADDLRADGRLDYVVTGEAEACIADLVASAHRQEQPEVIHAPLPDVEALPPPDFRAFYNHQDIRFYPLVSSRGCPYDCGFCAVRVVTSRAWRPRSIASCIAELRQQLDTLPGLRQVVIWDDNFSFDLTRGKALLRGYREAGFCYPLRPANLRADRCDDELIELLAATGCEEIQLGAEHGDPAVFATIRKGESLDDIRAAGHRVKAHGMKLVLSFVIGLPGDNVRKTLASVDLAQSLGADQCYWNILTPYRGTRFYDYFRTHGQVDDTRVPPTWSSALDPQPPNADTPDFPAHERILARRLAETLTGPAPFASPRFLMGSAVRYGFPLRLLRLAAATATTTHARSRAPTGGS